MTPLSVPPAAPLKRRFAALVYEMLLAGAVTCAAFVPAGVLAMLLNAVSPPAASFAVSLVLLYAWWLYFKTAWRRKGQTLAMQVWRIGLSAAAGGEPPLRLLRLRFIWACVFLVFVPMLAYAALNRGMGVPPGAAFGASLFWWILPWGFALFNADRQFLYDVLAGTRLTDLKAV
ncbi:RDD family [Kingella potus]|uniref:RDD family n=1 Tax=Kingella potus TaxID=265175 RepID=A0A377QZK7_9NEIS|nr:RDD family protein [Kingella potus]UOP01150.1 RDD family protein [Kingella potus]STR00854.1 RDD family [Kingella potus]